MKKHLVFIFVAALILSACRSAAPQPQATATSAPINSAPTATTTYTPLPPTETATPTLLPTATATPTEIPPQDCEPGNIPAGLNPLTCMPPDAASNLERRPVAVKVQLIPRSQRPSWSVSMADIVYDYYQNNGITRLNAIFYGNNPDKVGPVRSARLFDDYIIRMYEAIFAFGGGDQRILNRLYNSPYYPANRLVVEGTNSCPALCRADTNGLSLLFANPVEIGPYVVKNGGDNSRQPLEGMTFKQQPPENGDPAGENIYTRYSISSYVKWEYDPVSGNYLRWQDMAEAHTIGEEQYEKFIDPVNNDEQVAAQNVVVLLAFHDTTEFGKSGIVDIELGMGGKAYAFRDGKYYQLTWTYPGTGMLALFDQDGNPYAFKPGTTWFQVMGQSSTIVPTEDNGQRFEFRFP